MFWKVREQLSHVTSRCRAHARAGLRVSREIDFVWFLVNGRLAEVKEEETCS